MNPFPSTEQVRRIVVIVGVTTGHPVRPAQYGTDADGETHDGPETEPQLPTPPDVPRLPALVSLPPLAITGRHSTR